MTVKETTCLNCGTVCDGLYSPNCGQSTQTPARITMRTFGKRTTFIGLLVHPWIVIKEFLHGKWAIIFMIIYWIISSE